MKIYWNNLLDEAGLTASTTKTGTSVSNIIQKHLTKRLSFDGNSGYVDIDLGAITQIKKIIVGGSNNTDTFTIYGNTIADMTTPAFTQSLSLTDSTWETSFDESYRYWRLEGSEAAVTYLWLGYVFMGEGLQLPGIDPDYILNYNTTSSTTMSVSLQPYGNIGIKNFSSSFSFPIITDYERTATNGEAMATRIDILEMWYEVEGHTPFYLEIAEEALSTIPPYFGILAQGSLSFKLDKTQNFYKLKFKFQQTK